MIKKLISVIIASVWGITLFAQTNDETPVIINQDPVASPVMKKPTLADKVDINFSVGTSYLYSKSFGSGMASYVAPELSYSLTPRFRIHAGIMFLNSNVLVNRYSLNEPSVVVKTTPTTSALAYVAGSYLISDRFSVTGMVSRDMSNQQALGRNGYNPSIQAMSLHLDYKISDNITIGAGMQMRQGNNWGYPNQGFGMFPGGQYSPLLNY